MDRSTRRAAAFLLQVCLIAVVAAPAPAQESDPAAEPLQIAVAANFAGCLEQLSVLWQARGEPAPTLIVGSTGRHFAQIQAGAPFDLFLAADAERPRLLCESGEAVPGSRFTYALGRLVLWAPGLDTDPDATWVEALDDPALLHLAIADPRVAPYGQAAEQALERSGRRAAFEGRMVTGRSVGQAWQFVASGAAEAGLLAYSQTLAGAEPADVRPVPQDLYDPIGQQAVLLARARDNAAAARFLEFLRSPEASAVIVSFGYRVPSGETP